tara:strand:+ start:75 stop:1106 length:1032 start_codon:yes stop_codon:yes gene_type:complete
MKQLKNRSDTSFIKKLFVKICRKFGFELIDQNNFTIPTSNKVINQNLSKLGINSINLPLGEVKITRKVKSLDIIIRTCMEVNMLSQNKERIFEKDKPEYTLRSINSLINSATANENFKDVSIKFTVVDHNSSQENLDKIRNLFEKKNVRFNLINLNVEKFSKKIQKTNEKKETVTLNQISNMANIHQSLLESVKAEDLIYFVEDDYLHSKDCLEEMIFSYERISTQLGSELFLCPTDYPYLYSKIENTNIILGNRYHWRKIEETLCTFLSSKKMIKKYIENIKKMCEFEHYPFEKPLHEIYKKELCISPIPSLAIHFTNINSIFGLSPNVNWKKIWDENDLKN